VKPLLRIRVHGISGPWVVVLHGGPAAVGEAAGIARGLAGAFRVLEPWQRGSGDGPLCVATHVEDLHELIPQRCERTRPAIVGESWGAMLALAYAAAHPDTVGPLALVGCGTFDLAARARMKAIIEERTDPEMRRRIDLLQTECPDRGERLLRVHEMTRRIYMVDPLDEEADPETPPFDVRAHSDTWNDMLRLQAEGVYPAAFASVRSPVLMLHGAYDPHPGEMIRASLAPFLPQLRYREWERCGHSPWLERHVREEFFAELGAWLMAHGPGSSLQRPFGAADDIPLC
jgi:pimeloyl-ACP methyl ester carboxylesterase